MDPPALALAYHQITKHHLHRYARSLGYLDWATQPDPFRTYRGAPVVELPLLADTLSVSYRDLHVPGRLPPRPLALDTVALLFELSLGLSAWKQHGESRWALRCNPSSGNLHPTEGYAVLPARPGLVAGLYHYVSRDHSLERRVDLEGTAADRLGVLLGEGLLVGLSSIHWREAWKYGERAFRYSQLDLGHAIAALRYAAAALGLTARLVTGGADGALAALLGLDRAGDFAAVDPVEAEHPEALLWVGPAEGAGAAALWPERFAALAGLLRGGRWSGAANRLSPDHESWDLIDTVATATAGPLPAPWTDAITEPPPPLRPRSEVFAATLVRQRRSAVDLDGHTALPTETFYDMLDGLLPRPGVPPWDALPYGPLVHPVMFVHRVTGLPPGLYALLRSPDGLSVMRSHLRKEMGLVRPAGAPAHLPLYRLHEADLRPGAQIVSCHQAIAGDGAFSLGMLAELGDTVRQHGAALYRYLYWEAGVLGHELYLAAEAAGVRGTGIGCFFDDAFHELLGLEGDRLQSLYHFTVGGPVEDRRLQTHPPYAHLAGRAGLPPRCVLQP